MAGDEVGARDQIAGADGLAAEAKVRDGDSARLLGVVDEIALRIVRRILADDLDGILVGADGAVRPEAIEDSAHRFGVFGGEGRIIGQASMSDVIVYANDKMIARSWFGGVH